MTSRIRRSKSALLTFTLFISLGALTGCKGGGNAKADSVPAAAASGSNTAPTISGSAQTSIAPNTQFNFTPTAADAEGNRLSFQIENKPAWATFNTVNGQLTGTPPAAGTFAGIVISTTDGEMSAALPAFSINVTATPAVPASGLTLSWTAPTQNTDGTVLTDLAGFVIAYGTSSDALSQTVQVENPSIDRYVLDELPPGDYYFGVKAYTASGAESELSSIVHKVIG